MRDAEISALTLSYPSALWQLAERLPVPGVWHVPALPDQPHVTLGQARRPHRCTERYVRKAREDFPPEDLRIRSRVFGVPRLVEGILRACMTLHELKTASHEAGQDLTEPPAARRGQVSVERKPLEFPLVRRGLTDA